MRKPIIAIKLNPRQYSALVDLANRVLLYMSGNLNFATPMPTLGDLQTAVDQTSDAIARWGKVGNRGSHADVVDLQVKAKILHDMLKAEAQYVQTIAQVASSTDYAEMANIITSSGFALVKAPSPQGVLEKVQNFHQFVSRQLRSNEVKLKWKRPLNVSTVTNVKQYQVLRSSSTELATAEEIAIVSKTTFTDVNTAKDAVEWTYWVIAYGSAGAGVVSDPITVKVHGV